MSKLITRSLIVAATAGAVGAGAFAAAAPAHAAGDLKVTAGVVCEDKTAHRVVAVENLGPDTITGVRVGAIGDAEITIPAVKDGKPVAKGGWLVGSTDDIDAGKLAKGQTVVLSKKGGNCADPYAIVGYSIGNEIDNVFSAPNADLDWGLEVTTPAPDAPSTGGDTED